MDPDPALADEVLVERAKAAAEGDLRAFDLLVERHRDGVVTNCRYLTRSPQDSEDLAQEVFVKAFFGIRAFEGRSTFRTWIQRIKLNHCLNFMKRNTAVKHLEIDDPALADEASLRTEPADFGARDERAIIGAVLDSMPETLRVPLILCDHDGLSYQEIADALGLGLSAVKMRIKRAREEFRARYGQAGGRVVSEAE